MAEVAQAPPQKKYVNKVSRRNQIVFTVTLIALQLAVSVSYGVAGNVSIQEINVGSVLTAIFLAMLAVVGFGLYFCYMKHLVWSGLGFNLMLTCFAIQLYPLFNALWGKLHLHQTADSFTNKGFTLSLTVMDGTNYQNNSVTGAIKCAISLVVAFGSLIGRVGPLECLVLAVVGTAGYELNRSIVGGIGQDLFGSFTIFGFGGFMGVISGIIMRVRERRKFIDTTRHERVEGSSQMVIYSLMGSGAIFVLFPLLAFEGDQTLQGTSFQRFGAPLSVVLAMGSAVVTSVGVTLLVGGDETAIRVKDLVNAQIAGGIVSGAAAYYSSTPFLPLIAGVAAAVAQYFFDNFLERKVHRKWGVVSTYSFFLFCLQSLLAAVFAAAYNSRASKTTNGVVFPSLKGAGQEVIIYLISSGIGTGCGILVGTICFFLNNYRADQLFHDQTTFLPNDGIAFPTNKGPGSQRQPPSSSSESEGSSRILQPVEPQPTAGPQKDQMVSWPSQDEENQFDFIDMFSAAID